MQGDGAPEQEGFQLPGCMSHRGWRKELCEIRAYKLVSHMARVNSSGVVQLGNKEQHSSKIQDFSLQSFWRRRKTHLGK